MHNFCYTPIFFEFKSAKRLILPWSILFVLDFLMQYSFANLLWT